MYPKISIITPSYNQVKFIEQAIKSVLQQNYPDFEHIIIDNCSTDGTIKNIKKVPPSALDFRAGPGTKRCD